MLRFGLFSILLGLGCLLAGMIDLTVSGEAMGRYVMFTGMSIGAFGTMLTVLGGYHQRADYRV